MILILILILIIITIFIYFFVLNSVSPIPYFPTQWADLEFVSNEILNPKFQKISKSPNNQLPITSNHIIIDLGAGTGTVIFHAAKIIKNNSINKNIVTNLASKIPVSSDLGSRLDRGTHWNRETRYREANANFIAVEINPFLCWIMQLRRLTHPNRKNIQIIQGDIFKINLQDVIKSYSLNTEYRILITVYLYVGPYIWNSLIPTLKTAPKNTRILSYMYQIPGWEKRLVEVKTGKKKLYIYN